ncbi:MAG: prepilin-type N-terminal cleavage/methylation domain-containing protein [Candidatus Zixiibacteriota bacterium]
MSSRTQSHERRDQGFTLIEVLMTVVIIGILSTVALRALQNTVESARIRETQNEMDELAFAIAGNPDLYTNGLRVDFGYVGDNGSVPATLDNLVANPGGWATWRGPYIRHRFAEDPTGFKTDAWGNPYTLTTGITIASTGGGSLAMTKSVASAASDLTSTPVNGTVTDAAGNPPGDSNVAVTIRVTYPNGTGGTTTATATPSPGGAFSFAAIPAGIRTVEAIYRAMNDTVPAVACLLPRSGGTVALRLPRSPFAATGGGGGGGALIQFVPGTASSPSNNVQFSIFNAGSAGAIITSLTATYSPTAYYQTIRWGGTTVFNRSNPRAASGEECTFTSARTMAVGATVVVRLQAFRNAPVGGSNADMSNVDFTITFSNGQSVTFNSGP